MSTIRRVVLASVSMALPLAVLSPSAGAQGFDLAATKVVDLTHPIDASTIFWPTEAKTFELTEEHKGMTERGFFSRRTGFARQSTAARTSMRRIILPRRASRPTTSPWTV